MAKTQAKAHESAPLVVGVGASAGGLEAFQELLSALGDAPELAVVFVQHLDANSKSLLPGLLASNTSLKIVEVADRTKLAANTIYLCPPQTLLEIHGGSLLFASEGQSSRQPAPIDHFFHSISESQGERGIGVILSGAGSDGTLGLKAISDRGGMTFAQEPTTARFDSMPRSAATTGVADHLCSPREIGQELVKYCQFLTKSNTRLSGKQLTDSIEQAIPEIAEQLMQATGHNFQHYKTSTLGRRIQRRMQVLKIANVSAYVERMRDDEEESQLLFRELLIGVTDFFRDPESFQRLAQEVLPKVFTNRDLDDPVRIWVPGCASGEEAYTIAMLCREYLDKSGRDGSFQIFASDIDERALATARQGTYPIGIADHVSAERLEAFFIKKGTRYHVKQELRETVLFSSHNLISDPPFSRQDLISCRNLLIYLGPHLQKKLIPLFHYALRPNGYLFLGPSESMSSHGDLFRITDAKHRISQRKGTTIARSTPLPLGSATGGLHRQGNPVPVDDDKTDIVQIMQRIVLDEFAPKSVVVDEDGQVVCSSADTSKYLAIVEGAYQNNVLKMARRGLRIGLRAAMAEAKANRRRVTHENVSVQTDQGKQRVMLTVQPMMRLGEDCGLFLIVFHDVGLPLELSVNSEDYADELSSDLIARGSLDRAADLMIEQLERELTTTRDDLERTMQEMETANEELKSSNEELLSMNEELQSANEELETSKEEIRASSDAVTRAHDDLENLLRSTQIATIFLDDDLTIRRFTPAATEVYGLIPTDVGRPLTQIVPNVVEMPPLPTRLKLQGQATTEDTVIAFSGKSYIRRVLPYQSHLGASEGIVVTFTEVTQLRESQELFQLLVEASSQIVWITDAEGIVTEDSPSWREFTGQSHDEWIGHGWLDAIHPDDREATYSQWMSVVETGENLSLEYRLRHHSGGYRWSQVNAIAQRNADGSVKRWVGMNTDIDGQKRAAEDLAEAKSRLELSMRVSGVAPWNLDITNQQLITNATLNAMFGFEAEMQPSLAEFVARIDESARAQVSEAIDQSVENGARYDQEYPVNLPDGTVRHVRAVGQVRQSGDGDSRYFFGVVSDITDRKQRELDIAEREAHLRRVINNQLGLVGVIDRDGILLEVDERSLAIARSRREQVIGKPFAEAPWWNYDPAVADQMRDAIRRAFAGESVRFDVSLFAFGDEGVMIDFMIAPVFDAEGNVEYLIPSGVDIRERKELEHQQLNAVARLEAIFNTAVDGIITIDSQGSINSVNLAAANIFGYEQEELVGQNVKILMPEPECSNHDGFLARYDETGERSIIGSQRELIGRRKDESTFPLDLAVSETTLKGDHRYVGIVRDISDRAESERTLADSSKRMEMALRAGGMAAWEWTETESYWARELYDLLGIDPNLKAEPELFFSLVHPEDIEGLKNAWQTAVDGADNYECEFRINRPDGETRWITGMGEVTRDTKGRVARIYGINWDSTRDHLQAEALRESERRAKEASESKSAFLANMSHEIRTPMTAILGYADLIRDHVSDQEALGHLQTIRRNGDYLLEIINDILDLSKIEAGKLDISHERFDPTRLVEDVRSIMEVRAKENELELNVEYVGKMPAVIESDAKRLKQILVNLVGNAIKFTREGSVKLVVNYEETQGQLQLKVIDTGIGMTEEQRQKVFKPFEQGDSSVSRHFGGTGLGLTITRRLAKVLGGKIEVDSQIGQGSTFTATVATGNVQDVLLIDPNSHGQAIPQVESEVPVELNCHVLVVDDRRDIRFLTKLLLTDAGATVEECEDGQLAVDHVRERLNQENCPDLILLDMQMPNLDGYETAIQLRGLGYVGPIIALTADAMQGDMSRCIESGCNDYLSKPIDRSVLIKMVDEYLKAAE